MEDRAATLGPMCETGPGYDRNVAAALADHRLFLSRGEMEAAERYLLMAEMRAGLITFERFQELTGPR